MDALYELLGKEYESAESLREELRLILAPDLPPTPLDGGRVLIPRMD